MAKLTRVKGGTIIETLVASTIILVIFAVASVIFVSLNNPLSGLKVKAQEAITWYATKTSEENIFVDGELHKHPFLIKRTSLELPGSRLMQVEFVAYYREQAVLSCRKIMVAQ